MRWTKILPRLVVILLLVAAILARYGLNQLRTRAKHRDFAAPLDGEVPLDPEAIWIYMSLFPFAIRIALKAPRLRDLVAACRELWRIASVTAHYHVNYPSHFPRPAAVAAERALTGHYWKWLHLLDDANGTWPSGHVAQSVYLALVLERWKAPADEQADHLLWSLKIAASTMATKQHYLLDVLGGLVLASAPAEAAHERLVFVMENYPAICAGTRQIDVAWLHPAIHRALAQLAPPDGAAAQLAPSERALAHIAPVLAHLMHIAEPALAQGVRSKAHATRIMMRSMLAICRFEIAHARGRAAERPSPVHRPPPMTFAKHAIAKSFKTPG